MQHASDLSFEEDSHKGHGHPSVLFYNIVALILFVVTALEVGVLYPPLLYAGTYFRVILLVVLSIAKFIVVVAFFMHLFFDAPLCTFLFAIGMVIATGTVVALIHVMPAAEHPLMPRGKPKHPPATASPAPHAFLERMDEWRRVRLG